MHNQRMHDPLSCVLIQIVFHCFILAVSKVAGTLCKVGIGKGVFRAASLLECGGSALAGIVRQLLMWEHASFDGDS